MALVHECIDTAMHSGGIAFEISGIELVNQRTQQARSRSAEFGDEFRPILDAGRWRVFTNHSGVFHYPFDLLIELITIGHHENPGFRIVLHQPLGE